MEEECAIDGLVITEELPCSYHTYNHKGELVLKITYWYKMITASNKKLIPQAEEGITEVKWINESDLPEIKTNTYSSVVELLNYI